MTTDKNSRKKGVNQSLWPVIDWSKAEIVQAEGEEFSFAGVSGKSLEAVRDFQKEYNLSDGQLFDAMARGLTELMILCDKCGRYSPSVLTSMGECYFCNSNTSEIHVLKEDKEEEYKGRAERAEKKLSRIGAEVLR